MTRVKRIAFLVAVLCSPLVLLADWQDPFSATSTTRPTCDSTVEGQLWVSAATAGAATETAFCGCAAGPGACAWQMIPAVLVVTGTSDLRGTISNSTGDVTVGDTLQVISGSLTTATAINFRQTGASTANFTAGTTTGNMGMCYTGTTTDWTCATTDPRVDISSAGIVVLNAASGQDVRQAVNNVVVTQASSTGLAVTGAVSLTTDLTITGCTGTVAADAVTCSAAAGVITDDGTDINADTTRATITLTNTRIAATSVVHVDVQSAMDANALISCLAIPGSGSASVVCRNVGTGNYTSAGLKLGFTVIKIQ